MKQVCSLTSFSFNERERENSLFAKGTELHSRVLSRANAMNRPLCSVRSGVGGVSVLRRRRAGEQTRELTTMAPLPSPPRRVGEALSGGCFASLLGCRVFET